MDFDLTALVNSLLSPASTAALVGAVLLALMIVVRRIINGKLKPPWEGFVEKLWAIIGAAASGLVAVQQDALDDILRPILTAALVVGIAVGFYKYLGDMIFRKKPESPAEE